MTIPCEKAYGNSKPELLEVVDRSIMDKDIELQVGRQLEITNHDDSVFYVMIREVTAEQVTLDANHPLAGKDLTFEIKLLEVEKSQR